MDKEILRKYADLLVKVGLNVQKGQTLVISAPTETVDIVRCVTKAAYDVGAKEVVVNWGDEIVTKLKYLQAADEVFQTFPDWLKEFYNYYLKQGAAFLSIHASDPELLKDVKVERIAQANKVSSIALQEFRERLGSNKNAWSIISVPTVNWAKKVFPNESPEEAINKLWEAILKAVRVDTDNPIQAWELHKENLKQRLAFLNEKRFKFLHYHNSLGTDLKIELPEDHVWLGGSEFTPEKVEFIANMPTEEVFTMPKKDGVNGKVVSAMPISRNGTIIDNFTITFQDGKIVDYTAEKGLESLKELIETDEGSHYLGEVALVPYDSPISNMKILFYNTLFDENASCHLAIGRAYPVNLRGGENMSKEELAAKGANDSLVHQDFMIGTKDLEIIGITSDGDEITIFKDGNFAF